MSLHVSNTCAHHQVKIVFTASGNIKPIGGRPVGTGRPPMGLMIPEAV